MSKRNITRCIIVSVLLVAVGLFLVAGGIVNINKLLKGNVAGIEETISPSGIETSLNQYRADLGLQQFKQDSFLQGVADQRARDIVAMSPEAIGENLTNAHNPDKLSNEMSQYKGTDYYNSYAELLQTGWYQSNVDVVNIFKGSKEHETILKMADLNSMGVATIVWQYEGRSQVLEVVILGQKVSPNQQLLNNTGGNASMGSIISGIVCQNKVVVLSTLIGLIILCLGLLVLLRKHKRVLIIVAIFLLLLVLLIGWFGGKCYAEKLTSNNVAGSVAVSCNVLPYASLGINHNEAVFSTNTNNAYSISTIDNQNEVKNYTINNKVATLDVKNIKLISLVPGF